MSRGTDLERAAAKSRAAARRPMFAAGKPNSRVASPGPRLAPSAEDRRTDALAASLAADVREGRLTLDAARLIARLSDVAAGAA